MALFRLRSEPFAPRTFYPHQKRAYRYCEQTDTPALFMEMRLGKSPVIIRWAEAHNWKRILLVAPLTTLPAPAWSRELRLEGVPMGRIHLLSDLPTKQRFQYVKQHEGWHLINFEGLRAIPALAFINWDCVIVDESTRIRNPQAQITKLLTNGFQHVRSKAILSGLPRPKSDLDVFSQFRFLNGEFCGYDNYWKFKSAKYHQGWFEHDWQPNKGTRDLIKRETHTRAFCLTLKQAKMGNKKIYKARVVNMNATQRREQKLILKEFRSGVSGTDTKWVGARVTWLSKLAGGFAPDNTLVSDAKFKELDRIVREEFAGKPIVVWFRFNHELDEALHRLRKKRVRVAAINGATPKAERGPLISKFQRGQIQVLLMQGQVGQYGLDLSVADVAVYYSNTYDAEVRSQTEKRIEHMAKRDRPLLYIDLITRGSADDDVVESLKDKSWDIKRFSSRMLETLIRTIAA